MLGSNRWGTASEENGPAATHCSTSLTPTIERKEPPSATMTCGSGCNPVSRHREHVQRMTIGGGHSRDAASFSSDRALTVAHTRRAKRTRSAVKASLSAGRQERHAS
jgi:hypothetical protein